MVSNQYNGKSALIVEPADIMRTALIKMLREMGMYPIHQAARIQEAQRILTGANPDIIISERDINGTDGLELLQWVRENEATANTPFIFCTSLVDQKTVLKALKAGVTEYIAKPFSYASFHKKVEKAFKQPLNARIEDKFSHKVESEPEKLSIASFSQRVPEFSQSTFTTLVVDDTPDNIEIASQVMKKLGRVKCATSGKAAIELCNEFPPDLILLDIMMPEMDGYQVFQKLKENSMTKDIPVIFLTAKANEEDIVAGLSMGAVDYVTKPINAKILHARAANQKKQIEYQNNLQLQLDSYIENFALKADLERILFEHMRVPLNNLHDVANRLIRKSMTHSQAVQEGIRLEKVRTTIERLIESLNSMIKLEDKDFTPTIVTVNLTKIVSDVVGSLSREMTEKSLSLDSFVLPKSFVKGEEVLIYTMLSNLLLNAIEAAPRGSQLKIFHKQEKQEETLTLFNIGEVEQTIVDRFFDKYITKGKVNGTGLGTYSAKLITEAIGGSIALESEEGETRVRISFVRANR